jgi:hypothetical protein
MLARARKARQLVEVLGDAACDAIPMFVDAVIAELGRSGIDMRASSTTA